eukprot:m.7100 g.7100  ORF g.7100 m.7100 type:complete len:426 (+) comp8713_c0_seq1:76-1353(+)
MPDPACASCFDADSLVSVHCGDFICQDCFPQAVANDSCFCGEALTEVDVIGNVSDAACQGFLQRLASRQEPVAYQPPTDAELIAFLRTAPPDLHQCPICGSAGQHMGECSHVHHPNCPSPSGVTHYCRHCLALLAGGGFRELQTNRLHFPNIYGLCHPMIRANGNRVHAFMQQRGINEAPAQPAQPGANEERHAAGPAFAFQAQYRLAMQLRSQQLAAAQARITMYSIGAIFLATLIAPAVMVSTYETLPGLAILAACVYAAYLLVLTFLLWPPVFSVVLFYLIFSSVWGLVLGSAVAYGLYTRQESRSLWIVTPKLATTVAYSFWKGVLITFWQAVTTEPIINLLVFAMTGGVPLLLSIYKAFACLLCCRQELYRLAELRVAASNVEFGSGMIGRAVKQTHIVLHFTHELYCNLINVRIGVWGH